MKIERHTNTAECCEWCKAAIEKGVIQAVNPQQKKDIAPLAE